MNNRYTIRNSNGEIIAVEYYNFDQGVSIEQLALEAGLQVAGIATVDVSFENLETGEYSESITYSVNNLRERDMFLHA